MDPPRSGGEPPPPCFYERWLPSGDHANPWEEGTHDHEDLFDRFKEESVF